MLFFCYCSVYYFFYFSMEDYFYFMIFHCSLRITVVCFYNYLTIDRSEKKIVKCLRLKSIASRVIKKFEVAVNLNSNTKKTI